MQDLISRQAAIDAAVKMFEAWYGGSVLRDREIRARFDALPSAQSKTGTWIKRPKGALGYICTACGKSDVSNKFDYCPNCGAKMRGDRK